jgi:PAS domain S-box-containing protein
VTTVHTEPPDFRALFEAGPGLCLLLSPELTVVGASDSYLRATFTRREDVLLRGLFEAFPERHEDLSAEGTSLLRTSLERVLERGTSDTMPMKTVDVRLPRESGGGFEQRYFVPVNSPVFGSDQRLLYIIHRVDDVTDLVRLQRARALPTPQEEAQRIRADRREADGLCEVPRIAPGRAVESAGQDLHTAILRNMTEGICLVRTEDHVIVYTDPRFDIMLGYEAGELAGKPAEVLSQYGDGGGERFEEVLAELNLKGEATYEVRVLRKDKRVVWHRVHTSRLEHSTLGTVWVAVHEDISRRKESAEDLDNFFSMSLDLLGIGTFDGYFTRLNPA